MTYPDPPIILDVDASGYITGLGQAERATDSFSGQVRSTALALGPMRAALDAATPSRALLAGMTGFTVVAGKNEAQLSTLRATSKTVDANFGALTKSTRSLAKEFPVSNSGARELVTTMSKLGIATKGQERTVGDLAKVYTKLSGATGEGATGLAMGLTQLNRATDVGQSPERVEKLADALTTVSAETGTSATGVVSFAKAIAPMADASGIGATKIMGISAAFGRLGEDGFGAANAFNKMLGDLNRSVREGSPEMAKYAQIVGTSATEFERLFKADPTEAITQVTEAIGRAGENGPRMLEQLGLEGVRTQRSLQQLSAGGGLREAVASATGGYGSGATQTAADAAYGGLADSTQRLANVTEQAADALGMPFLGAVSMATDVLGAAVSGFEKTVSSSPVQGTLKTLAYAALPLLAAFKLVPSLVTALGIGQLATSGPAKAVAGAYAASNAPLNRFVGRALGGDDFNERRARGDLGTARMAPINERVANVAGRAFSIFPAPTGTGPGLPRQILGAGALAGGLYLRALSESTRQVRYNFANRGETRMAPFTPAARDFMAGYRDLRSQRDAGTIDSSQMRAALRQLGQEAAGQTKPIRTLALGLGELGRQVAISSAVMPARLGLAGARGARSLVSGGVAAAGGVAGVGITAALAGVAMKGKSDEEDDRRREASRNATTFIDDYRVAMGKATDATSTFAGSMAAAAKANETRDMTVTAAMKVTEQDQRAAAGLTSKDRLKDYGNDTDAAARRISLEMTGQEMAADEIQRVQQDLFLSGMNRGQVQDVMDQVSPGQLDTDTRGAVAGRVSDIAAMPDADRALNSLDLFGLLSNSSGADDTGLTIDNLSKDQQKAGDELIKGIMSRADQQSAKYSPEFGQNEELKNVDAAITAAFESGNNDLAEALQKSYAEQSGVEGFDMIGGNEIRTKFDGSFTQALAAEDRGYREGTYEPTREAVREGRAGADMAESWVTEQLGSSPLAALFSEAGSGKANSLVRRLMNDPESPRLQQSAVQATVGEARMAGTSFVDLARQATDAANQLGQLDDATIAFLGALRQAAQLQVQAQAPYRSTSQTRQDRAQLAAGDARMTSRTREGREQQRQGVVDLMAVRDEALASAKAQVTARREAMIGLQRMEQDYNRQRSFALADYDTQIERATEGHQITLARTERGYLRSRARAQEDFQRGRRIALRDFNRQMERLAEDGARGLYDAYTRIQVQPIWDTANLTMNLEDQNQAIADQLSNLGKLRAGGGSNDLISLLGLNDPKNAQQLAEIVDQMSQDPAVVGALEKTARGRMRLGGALTKDAANVGITRAAEDFATSMRDQSEAFAVSMRRGTEEYETALADMNADHARALEFAAADQGRAMDRMAEQQRLTLDRMNADIARADEEIVTDLAGYHELLTSMINGQTLNFRGKTQSTLAGTLEDVRLFKDELEQVILDMGPGIFVTMSGSIGNEAGTREARQAAGRGFQATGGPSSGDEAASSGFAQPTFGQITSGFGSRKAPKTGATTLHPGVDYGVPVGTPVRAAWAGEVTFAGRRGTYGNLVVVDHGRGRETRYAHLSGFEARVGAQVGAGERIALSGNTGNSTGPHLHFETRQGGQAVNPSRAASTWAFAKGGIATEPTRALIAEAGSNEAVIPLNAQGVGALAKALREFVGVDDARALKAAAGTVIHTYDQSVHHSDHSTRFEGPIHVTAQDPNEMARKLAARTRKAALTAPPQRR